MNNLRWAIGHAVRTSVEAADILSFRAVRKVVPCDHTASQALFCLRGAVQEGVGDARWAIYGRLTGEA